MPGSGVGAAGASVAPNVPYMIQLGSQPKSQQEAGYTSSYEIHPPPISNCETVSAVGTPTSGVLDHVDAEAPKPSVPHRRMLPV